MIIGQIIDIPVKDSVYQFRLIGEYNEYYLFERIRDCEVLYRECFHKTFFKNWQ